MQTATETEHPVIDDIMSANPRSQDKQQTSSVINYQFPTRLNGIDLKKAEQITRRLLLSEQAIPNYHLLPLIPEYDQNPKLNDFLHKHGFDTLHPALSNSDNKNINPQRGQKKQQQVYNLVSAVSILAGQKQHGHIVDLCGGCGHVALVLAALFPSWSITIVDKNQRALEIANTRAQKAGLSNISTLHTNIQDLEIPFDIAVALHACGGATDVALALTAAAGAAAVVAPCCVGGVVSEKGNVTGRPNGATVSDPTSMNGEPIEWGVPRSKAFQELISDGEYVPLARAADYGEENPPGQDDWRRVTRSLTNWDRLLWMTDAAMCAYLVKMRPVACSPKNDVIVVWSNKQFEHVSQMEWRRDDLHNGFIRDVQEGHIMNGLGVKEVKEVEKTLQDRVCAAGSSGVYIASPGMGKRKRKVFHAVAESMGLWHCSQGRGVDRAVVVKRNQWWPLFFESYVAVGGPQVDEIGKALLNVVPNDCVEKRAQLRGTPHHITLVGPKDISKMPSMFKKNQEICLQEAHEALSGTQFRILGVGRVKTLLSKHGSSEENEAYYAVVDWPEAQSFRRKMGLPKCDLHITLGFRVKDIHDKAKNETTIFHYEERKCSPWIA